MEIRVHIKYHHGISLKCECTYMYESKKICLYDIDVSLAIGT